MNTPEEVDIPMPWCESCHSYHVDPSAGGHHRLLQCKAPLRFSTDEWNYVDEQMPDDEISVLVAFDEGEITEAYHENGAWFRAYQCSEIAGVYAWAHVPECPLKPKPVSSSGSPTN